MSIGNHEKDFDHRKVWAAGYFQGRRRASLHANVRPALSARNAVICWNPGTSHVKVLRHPDTSGKSDKYEMTAFGCYSSIQKMTLDQRVAHVFITAWHMVVRDKCDALAVHKAMLGIEEYHIGLSEDFPS